MSLDVLVAVPFEPDEAAALDPRVRPTYAAHQAMPLVLATTRFERFVGRPLNLWGPENRPSFDGTRFPVTQHRSLTAITLASQLERAGLSWRALDPGPADLGWWRRQLESVRDARPRAVAVSSTFVTSDRWLKSFCAIVRQTFPSATVLLGGYYYTTSARDFLACDADVFCVGEGEERLARLVERVRDGRSVDDVRGIYVRRPDGTLLETGHAPSIAMVDLPPVDWSLAARIEPPADLSQNSEFPVETQRGCVFKCEYCTYRTLALPNALGPEAAVEAILRTAASGCSAVCLTDATATYPHERWERVLELLVARGGSPRPIWAYARVSDISERVAGLMGRAGVRHVYVGQESGDQRMLNLMKKGTRVDQVRPAIAAMARHGITATLAFIHGFPGETDASLAATRHLLATMNDGFENDPVVLQYALHSFALQDFSAIAQTTGGPGDDTRRAGATSTLPPLRVAAAILETIIATSRVPHAPIRFYIPASPFTHGIGFATHPRRRDIFRWRKAIERGIAIFLEDELEGRKPLLAELRRLREVVLAPYPTGGTAPRVVPRTVDWYLRSLGREWAGEASRRPGLLTRVWLARQAQAAFGRPAVAMRTFTSGAWPDCERKHEGQPASRSGAVVRLAKQLVTDSVARARRARVATAAAPAAAPVRDLLPP